MNVEVKRRAWNTLTKTAAWVELQNTPGSGERWSEKIYDKISEVAEAKVEFAICNNKSLARYEYRCFHIGEWVIAYKITKNKFTVYRLIHGSRLK